MRPFPNHAPLSRAGLARIQELLGAQLPDAYVEFLAVTNGGFVRADDPDRQLRFAYDRNVEVSGNLCKRLTGSLSFLFGIGDLGHDGAEDTVTYDAAGVYRNLTAYDEVGFKRDAFPIGETSSSDIVAIDLNPPAYGRIILYAHDEYPIPACGYHIVCASFADFLNIQEEHLDDDGG